MNRRYLIPLRDTSIMTIRRRKFVRGVSLAVFGLSGCSGVNSGGMTDIAISNETTNEVTVTIQVGRLSDDEQLLDETVDIDADATQEYDEVVSGEEAQVYIRVQNGPENTFEWSDGETDASGLLIDINSGSITFSPIIR